MLGMGVVAVVDKDEGWLTRKKNKKNKKSRVVLGCDHFISSLVAITTDKRSNIPSKMKKWL
jgi:hypothetical protein